MGPTLHNPNTLTADGPEIGDIAHTVAYDRAGRGRSASAAEPQNNDDMAATLVALVQALTPGRVILVGHSMGGLIVRRAAETLSPAGLVLLDPTPEAIDEFRRRPPEPPKSGVIVISAIHAARYQARNLDLMREYQHRYAEQVGGQYEDAASEHIIPAERPEQVAAAVRRLVNA
ncbi:alpha/beta fold hydrolase [Nocardia sp. CA-120079]|uniref:alpha/beta fold hydrolase n=1 Tax=Nocardia sp. CA-120079 TaxID=3239974 RepID=UPI003D99F23D